MDLTRKIESAHFAAQGRLARMGNYYRWILANFEGFIGRRIWDAGAGIGSVSELLSERCDLLLATEFTESNMEALRERFAGREGVRVEFCDLAGDEALAFSGHDLDTVITLDVLEHLEDDARALRIYYEVLRPGGHLLIKVPAHPFLYGTMDKASLHRRRYTKRELRAKLQAAGFRVKRLRHMNLAATLPYLIKGRILKRESNFSISIDGSKLGFYNRLMPWLERAERILPPPCGLSLVAVGEKDE